VAVTAERFDWAASLPVNFFRVELKSWENHYAKIEKLPWGGKKVHCAEKWEN